VQHGIEPEDKSSVADVRPMTRTLRYRFCSDRPGKMVISPSPFPNLWKDLETTDAMANPNPSPSTCFGAPEGNTPRAKQKGARDRLSAAFLTDFADDYDANGKAVIETVRGQDPVAYMRLAAALLPTKVEISESPFDGLTEEQLDAYMEQAHGRILERVAKGDPEAIEQARKLEILP
jgi:hypothetical protein